MFEHIPEITEESIDVVFQKELLYFHGLLKQCCERSKTPDGAIDSMCSKLGFAKSNPGLVKAAKGCARGVAGELEGKVEPASAGWLAAMCGVFGLLATLRLVDRAIEARELEQKLGS